MIPKDIARLIGAVKINILSDEEQETLNKWRSESQENEDAYQYAIGKKGWYEDLLMLNNIQVERAVAKVLAKIESRPIVRPLWYRLRYASIAAAVILITMTFLWFYTEQSSSAIQPGGKRAVLTLADGSSITLNENQNELIISDSLFYSDGSSLQGIDKELASAEYMEISTPKGGEYVVVLSDNTRIRLNAASKLRFPKQFSKSGNRVVELEGEGYFEVNKNLDIDNTLQAFLVKTKSQTVRVLGTQFNISAYSDDVATYTTLVEGKVNVETFGTANKLVELTPGHQAVYTSSQSLTVKEVDVYSYVAWTKNQFVFAAEPLEEVMKRVCRWYNIDYEFEDKTLKTERIEGILPRYATVEDLLELLQESGQINFKIKNKKIYIY